MHFVRPHTLRGPDDLPSPASFETAIYMTLDVGDTGVMGSLVLSCVILERCSTTVPARSCPGDREAENMKVPRLSGECRTKSYTLHNNVVILDLNLT